MDDAMEQSFFRLKDIMLFLMSDAARGQRISICMVPKPLSYSKWFFDVFWASIAMKRVSDLANSSHFCALKGFEQIVGKH